MKNVTALLFLPGDRHILAGTKVFYSFFSFFFVFVILIGPLTSTLKFQDGNMFLFELASNELVQTYKKVHSAAIWKLINSPDKVFPSVIFASGLKI